MCERRVNLLVCSLPSHRHSYVAWIGAFSQERQELCLKKRIHLGESSSWDSVGPVPLVLDLHIPHDRVGSSTDPTRNGHLRYPNNLDQSLNDTTADKIRKYRADYNNRPPRKRILAWSFPDTFPPMLPISNAKLRTRRRTTMTSAANASRVDTDLAIFVEPRVWTRKNKKCRVRNTCSKDLMNYVYSHRDTMTMKLGRQGAWRGGGV